MSKRAWTINCPLISKSSYPFAKYLGIVPSAPVNMDKNSPSLFLSFFFLFFGKVQEIISFRFVLFSFGGLPEW